MENEQNIIGIMGDTHKVDKSIIIAIAKIFKEAGVKLITHAGDIWKDHLNPEYFGNIPVICALTNKQEFSPDFQFPPSGWAFTTPGKRIKIIDGGPLYLGHRRLETLLTTTGFDFHRTTIRDIDQACNGIKLVIAGHTHRKYYDEDLLVTCINPGAVEGGLRGHAYAILETNSHGKKMIFSRIMSTTPTIESFTIAVISDSKNISDLNPCFWEKLSKKLHQKGVKSIIHCGNLAEKDIGRSELKGFDVYFNLHNNQKKPKDIPSSWYLIDPEYPIVQLGGYHFCVQHQLGETFADRNETDMLRLSLSLTSKYPFTDYILFGLTHRPFLEESDSVFFLTPGDVINRLGFMTIELPKNEITFDRIPFDPLPAL